MNVIALIMTACTGERFGARKQSTVLSGRPMLAWSAEVLADSPRVSALVLVTPPGEEDALRAALGPLAGHQPSAAAVATQEPAVSIKRSITPYHLICLEDGKKFKSLKRHLRTKYGMTPDEYRSKWGLPADYPMVAPNYARERSNLAKRMGLGQARKGGCIGK